MCRWVTAWVETKTHRRVPRCGDGGGGSMNLGRWIVVVGISLWSALAGAQSWQTKPVKIIVPFTAGSAADILARTFGQELQEFGGPPVVIENRPGAGGTVGAGVVDNAPGDGHNPLVA